MAKKAVFSHHWEDGDRLFTIETSFALPNGIEAEVAQLCGYLASCPDAYTLIVRTPGDERYPEVEFAIAEALSKATGAQVGVFLKIWTREPA